MGAKQRVEVRKRLRALLEDLVARKGGTPAAGSRRGRPPAAGGRTRARDLALLAAVVPLYELDEQDRRRVGDWLADESDPSAVQLARFARLTGVSLNWLLVGGSERPEYAAESRPWTELAEGLAERLRTEVYAAAERAGYWHRAPKVPLTPAALHIDAAPLLADVAHRAVTAFQAYYVAVSDAAEEDQRAERAEAALQDLHELATQAVLFADDAGVAPPHITVDAIDRAHDLAGRHPGLLRADRAEHVANPPAAECPAVLHPEACADAFGGRPVDYMSSTPGARFYEPQRDAALLSL